MLQHAFGGDAGERLCRENGKKRIGQELRPGFYAAQAMISQNPCARLEEDGLAGLPCCCVPTKILCLKRFSTVFAGSLGNACQVADNLGSEPKISIEPRADQGRPDRAKSPGKYPGGCYLVLIPVTVTDP